MPLVITQERKRLDLNLPKIKQGKQGVSKKAETKQVKRFAPEKNQFLTGPTENKFELSEADKYMYTRRSAAQKRIKKKVEELKKEDRVKRISQ